MDLTKNKYSKLRLKDIFDLKGENDD